MKRRGFIKLLGGAIPGVLVAHPLSRALWELSNTSPPKQAACAEAVEMYLRTITCKSYDALLWNTLKQQT